MKNLSPTMHRTLAKLTTTYQSPKELGESINTLEALVRRNLAESDYTLEDMLRITGVRYRIKKGK